MDAALTRIIIGLLRLSALLACALNSTAVIFDRSIRFCLPVHVRFAHEDALARWDPDPNWREIEAKLRQMRWSPEQISGWLSEQGIKLSHERIYQMTWDDKRNGGNLWRCLRRRGKRYNKRAGKNAGRGLIPNKNRHFRASSHCRA